GGTLRGAGRPGAGRVGRGPRPATGGAPATTASRRGRRRWAEAWPAIGSPRRRAATAETRGSRDRRARRRRAPESTTDRGEEEAHDLPAPTPRPNRRALVRPT